MAGALTISTLNNDTGVLATQNGMTGIAKAWVNFNGTVNPSTIRGSFNVSSVTYNGTANFTVNYTTAMPNTNYAVVGANNWDNGSVNLVFSVIGLTTTTTTVRTVYGQNNDGYNPLACFVAVFSS